MSYITVAGDVSDPTGLAEPNCLIKFVADVSYNKTLKNSVSIIPVASDGSYSTQLSKGAFLVGIDYSGKGSFSPIGRFVIDDNTASPITLADLLNDGKLTTSLSTTDLNTLKNSVSSAIASENAAATSATAAQASASAAAESAASLNYFESQGAVLIVPSDYSVEGDEPATVITDPNLPNEIALNSRYVLNNPTGENCQVNAEVQINGIWFATKTWLDKDLSSGYTIEATTRTTKCSSIPDIVIYTKHYSADGGGFKVQFYKDQPKAKCRVWCYPVKQTGAAN